MTPAHAWEASAACRTVDPDLWHPTRQQGGAEAKRICNTRCPVRAECLAAAMAEEDGVGPDYRHGIRGGLSGRQRHRLAREQRQQQEAPT